MEKDINGADNYTPADQDYWTIKAMRTYGGSFVQQLAALAEHADQLNMQKIKDTWPEYWFEYTEKGRILKQRS